MPQKGERTSKKVATVSVGTTSERFGFVHRYKETFGVTFLCRWLEVSRSGYYAWLHRPEPDSVESDRQLLKLITKIYERSHGRYGSPRVFHTLSQMGVRTSEKRVARLMRESGLKARVTRVTRRQPGLKRFQSKGKNLLLERGDATGIDQVWVADVTYIKLAGKWTYELPPLK